MFCNTHRYIGKFIGKTIEQKSDYALDMKAFKHGCMIPDLAREYKRIPHYKDKSFDFVQKLICSLTDNKAQEPSDYEVQLGVVSHYICDYFCQMHNLPKKANIVYHLLYEIYLMFAIKRACITDICDNQFDLLQNHLPKTAEEITLLIEETHLQYMEEKQSIRNDIHYAVAASLMVVASVINCTHPDIAQISA
ncbi:MAG: zinc dependent phospholipase C family protein [Bacillota bacterium]|nr:zinc dependent phospholipase C family protein [Bacillota bacterium]